MGFESRVWQAVTIVAVVLTAIVPAYVAYNLFTKGPAGPKQLELLKIPPRNLWWADLSPLPKTIIPLFRFGDQTVNNLALAQVYVRNIGNSPILPSDFYKDFTASVSAPWKILAIVSNSNHVEVRWKKISDNKAEAQPMLLNPGDTISLALYLTNTSKVSLEDSDLLTANFQFIAHIANMRDFIEAPSQGPLVERMWVSVVVAD